MTRQAPLDERLLPLLTDDPQTATEIWRRFSGQPDGRLTLSTRMRRQRRMIGAMLEVLAEEGKITRGEVERRGVKVPAYSRKRGLLREDHSEIRIVRRRVGE